jgi:hypothetical protein
MTESYEERPTAAHENLPVDLRLDIVITDIESIFDEIKDEIKDDVVNNLGQIDLDEAFEKMSKVDKILGAYLKKLRWDHVV